MILWAVWAQGPLAKQGNNRLAGTIASREGSREATQTPCVKAVTGVLHHPRRVLAAGVQAEAHRRWIPRAEEEAALLLL